jgi:hypothetical protein
MEANPKLQHVLLAMEAGKPGAGSASGENGVQEADVQLLLPPKDVSDSAEADQLGILEPPPQPTEESEADLQHHLQRLHEHMDTLDVGSIKLTLNKASEEDHAHHLNRLHEHMDTLDMSSVKSNLKERGC